jgi:hypothetical protein
MISTIFRAIKASVNAHEFFVGIETYFDFFQSFNWEVRSSEEAKTIEMLTGIQARIQKIQTGPNLTESTPINTDPIVAIKKAYFALFRDAFSELGNIDHSIYVDEDARPIAA